MRRTTNEAEDLKGEEPEGAEALDQEFQDRTVVLSKEPLPRKVKLIASGVEEIRCVSCRRVKPIADADEYGEGWICGECLSESKEES